MVEVFKSDDSTHEVAYTTLYTVIHIFVGDALDRIVYVHRSEYKHWDA